MKILLVDDEPFALRELEKCVKEVRPDAEPASFGYSDEALAFAKDGNAIDVAILDVNMPNMNGIELAKELKKINPLVNVIFCTAYEKYTMDAIRLHASGYVNKPYKTDDIARELDDLLHPVDPVKSKIFVRTFGDFDVFVDGRVMTNFGRSKAKELFAYLVSKRGGTANKKECIAVLFGDKFTQSTQDYFKKVFRELMDTLRNYGIENVIVKGYNEYAVDVNSFACDLYDYDRGLPQAINAYKGEFMAQYEWAEL